MTPSLMLPGPDALHSLDPSSVSVVIVIVVVFEHFQLVIFLNSFALSFNTCFDLC